MLQHRRQKQLLRKCFYILHLGENRCNWNGWTDFLFSEQII
ncbi:hypothetical protein T06_13667 [Trichinella sp. T6]|uniref:Uncharacterized protein n=1 Tax=Trichinella murrelli TaxID=144512 RepID=A0A0V0TF90_9BILA|nr:hypothetical protein T05_7950 [Trichinella murrelli]KRX78482.1 hypothetical protein T06_13667 [Trichinella sp. T6]